MLEAERPCEPNLNMILIEMNASFWNYVRIQLVWVVFLIWSTTITWIFMKHGDIHGPQRLIPTDFNSIPSTGQSFYLTSDGYPITSD